MKLNANPITLAKNIYTCIRSETPWKNFNYKQKVIFVHIPKNAGISIETALFQDKVGHSPLYLYQYHDPKAFRECFRFTVVRNPVDRFFSAFFFLKAGGRNRTDKSWAERWLGSSNSIEAFCDRLGSDQAYRRSVTEWQHFRPQWHYLTDMKGNFNLDYIGRFEQLQDTFEYVKERLGIGHDLPHLNRSNSKDDLTRNISESHIELIKTIYHKDINFFGYSGY